VTEAAHEAVAAAHEAEAAHEAAAAAHEAELAEAAQEAEAEAEAGLSTLASPYKQSDWNRPKST